MGRPRKNHDAPKEETPLKDTPVSELTPEFIEAADIEADTPITAGSTLKPIKEAVEPAPVVADIPPEPATLTCVYIWDRVLGGEAVFAPPILVNRLRYKVWLPSGASLASDESLGICVRLASGNLVSAGDALGAALKGLGGFSVEGAGLAHRFGH